MSVNCRDCNHCHVPTGWLTVALGCDTPWCSAAETLAGNEPVNGPLCAKMRAFGSCGAEGKLFEPTRGLKDKFTK